MNATIDKAARQGVAGRNSPQQFKPFPAYGKRLMELRMAGQVPDNSVVVTYDWRIGGVYPRVVITDNTPPDRMEWRYLAGLDVMLPYRDADAPKVPELVQAILAANPRCLVALHMGERRFIVVKNLRGEVML